MIPNGNYLIDDMGGSSYLSMKFKDEESNFMRYIDYPVIEYVPDYILGEGVLGRCFTSRGLVQLKRTLGGHVKDRVKKHEITHFEHPEWSEWLVREKTGTQKPPSEWYL